MIYFALTRMWLYHGKVNEKKFAKFTESLDVKGKTIAEHAIKEGKIISRWRDFSAEQAEGHNLYPCIDLTPDSETLKHFDADFLANTEGCRLHDCVFRITDFGYLNVLLVFAVENVESLSRLVVLQANITRKINEWIPALDPILDDLLEKDFVRISDDYFGIPLKIKDVLSIDSTDTYTYQDITILTGAGTENFPPLLDKVRKLYEISDKGEKIDRFEVHGIDQSPIVCTDKELDSQEIFDIVEPYNLLLAEINTYDSVSNLNYAIIKLMNDSELSKSGKRGWFGRNKVVSAFNKFTSSDLRKLTINTHYILHCINFRKTAI
ncbi:MAG: hypothetical protein LBN23_06365, partial [Paludibacter sp.]|nr:hypothetical protein [Paludibacter sp.]